MSPSRTAAYLVAAVLFAAWLASAAGISRRPRSVATPRPASQVEGVEALAADVQSQAARLRKRIATAPAPQAPARNPFSFADPGPRAARAQRRAEAHEISRPPLTNPEPPEPREPELTLLGVAEQQTAAGVVRTAMLGGRG